MLPCLPCLLFECLSGYVRISNIHLTLFALALLVITIVFIVNSIAFNYVYSPILSKYNIYLNNTRKKNKYLLLCFNKTTRASSILPPPRIHAWNPSRAHLPRLADTGKIASTDNILTYILYLSVRKVKETI